MEYIFLIISIVLIGAFVNRLIFNIKRIRRRNYYRDVYLKSDAWKRKRYLVLKRDNWTCVYCGKRATQVHHKKYAKNDIGREPIDWLESVCKSCHDHGIIKLAKRVKAIDRKASKT